jgi:rod shape-determining protein MreC
MLKRVLIIALSLGMLFILLARLLGISEGHLEHIASMATYPFLKLQHMVLQPVHNWQYRNRVKQNLLSSYEQVVHERNELQKELIALKGQIHHAEATKDLRTYTKRFFEDPIIAPILLKSLGKNQQFLLIDAGSASGVQVDMIAVVNDCLIGKVTEIYPQYSKVLLISDPTCKVAAFCSSSGVKGIHMGQRNGLMILEYVDHRDIVTEGDLVLSSGLGGLFPRGFGLGTVSQVQSTPHGRSIVVTPCIDIQEIDYVSIVPNTVTVKS